MTGPEHDTLLAYDDMWHFRSHTDVLQRAHTHTHTHTATHTSYRLLRLLLFLTSVALNVPKSMSTNTVYVKQHLIRVKAFNSTFALYSSRLNIYSV